MKSICLIIATLFLLVSLNNIGNSQEIVIDNPEIITGHLITMSKEIKSIGYQDTIAKSHPKKRKKKPGYHPKHDWILHKKVNPLALPLGEDPAIQKEYSQLKSAPSLLKSFEGITNTAVDPGDPSVAVGPNHVVQMTNAGDGSVIKIYNKDGIVLKSKHLMDGISGISGLGDPIVVYDHLADRWLLTEFADDQAVGNKLICMVSQSADPTGAYFVYSFDTPNFPDYPKYGLWPNAYIVTTNEDDAQAVYAMDRVKMLAGQQSATMQRFADIDFFQTIGFQASTPVNLTGSSLPPTATPPMIMRMADDGWRGVSNDRLEIWELQLNFQNASTSRLTRTKTLNTEPFDTELCGYTSFGCIKQPGNNSETLDPLREVIMNRIYYRNFNSHASMVLSHATDVGGDRAGVRWYELRKVGNEDWTIYQQGTYAPEDGNSRWMSSIGINRDGSIGLAYNVSGSTTHPSIKFTGRKSCDPLGIMSSTEQMGQEGSGSNASNRYGDYNDMGIDPIDGTFWFTGQYNPSSDWSTRIINFRITSDCNPSDCNDAADLSGIIADGTYKHSNKLSSNGSIPTNGNVIFQGTNAIHFLKNFSIAEKGTLEAIISDCNN